MFEVTMSGPGKNSLGTEMMRFLLGKLKEAKGAPILLTGAGDAFSAGLNLREVASLDAPGMEVFLSLLEEVVSALYSYPGPVVACINGHAIAGGCVVALCCDYRIAPRNPRIKIGLNEVALGLRFPPRLFSLVRRRVPSHRIEEVILGAGLYDPEGAQKVGLIDEVAEDPLDAAKRRLDLYASYPSHIYAANKRDIRGVLQATKEEEERFRSEALPIWVGPELKQRIMAVLGR